MDKVAICNMALGLLGQHKIKTMEDESVQAELCSTFFDAAVSYCLEQKAWLFATEFIDLGAAQVSNDPVLPSKFGVPGDVVTVHAVDDGSGSFDLPWERRGLAWCYTESSQVCKAKVTKQVDPSLFTPTFCWAVACQVGASIALPLTENAGLEAKLEKKRDDYIELGGSLDGMQASQRPIKSRLSLHR